MVHHKVELTPGNINQYGIALGSDNLVSLCHECHNKRHGTDMAVADGFMFDESGQLVRDGGAPGYPAL